MTSWTKEELEAIDKDKKLFISIPNNDGTMHKPTWVWIVQAGGYLYSRAHAGVNGKWYAAAKAAGRGHLSVGGVEKNVVFEFPADVETNDAVDEGYRLKYGDNPYLETMIGEQQREATVRYIPQ